MKLDEICDDILINIFRRLSVDDMCNVALVNKRFKSIICLPFVWKNKEIHLTFDTIHQEIVDCLIDRNIRKIRISRVKNNFKLLLNGLFRLESLNLYNCEGITNDLICDSLRGLCLTNLSALNVKFCEQIENETYRKIAESMPNLTEIHITSQKLLDDKLEIIVRKLEKLKILIISGCEQLTNKSMQTINTHGLNIELLDIEDCIGIDATGIKNLSMDGLFKLKHLTMGPIDGLTDNDIKRLAQSKYYLESLEIRDYDILTDQSMAYIVQYMLSLKYLTTSIPQLTDNALKMLSQSKSLKDIKLLEVLYVTKAGINHLPTQIERLNSVLVMWQKRKNKKRRK